MFTPTETQQKSSFINQEVGRVITDLGSSILPGFSHNILHEVSEQFLKVSYILEHTEEDKPIVTEPICKVLCNFLQFYIVANFIFPYHSNPPAEEIPLIQKSLSFKIHTNNTSKSITINPGSILSQISFDTITIATPLKSVISNLISDQLRHHSIIDLRKPFTLSFSAIFDMQFDLAKLNYHLTTNLPVIKDTSQLYSILNLYYTSTITNILPGNQPTDLKLAVIHIKNPQSRTSQASISTSLVTSNINPTTFIKYLCNTQYTHPDFGIICEVDHKKLNALPNLQECPLKYHKQSPTNSTTAIYELVPNKPTQEKFCKHVLSYINLFNNLYGEQGLKLSIELVLKEETTVELKINPTTELSLKKVHSLELYPNIDLQEILFDICSLPKQNFLSRMFSKKHIDLQIEQVLSKYNIYLHITPSQNISKSTLPSRQTSQIIATQDDSTTESQAESMEHTRSTTCLDDIDKQSSSIDQAIRFKETAIHIFPDSTTETPSQTQPSTSQAVTPITRRDSSSTIASSSLQKKREPFTTQTSHYTRTGEQGTPTLRKATKPLQTNKLIHKNHYKKNMIFAFIGISIFTISSILAYYALSNKFLTNYTDTKINQVVILGILCLSIIALIGTTLYYYIKAPNNLTESTTNIQQNTTAINK
ncbi:hypothetical protein [Ehrlichia muris]|uniref:Uncharacterized protein n=1 Tax=Ehrlichia muris AS145 TaxID=1423892 RepID=V9R9W4_9RICK|nr:hypothetical protein [Ehrlichia muris]AHC39661.1 hypothetical protein EMUR_00430 [Ehrlichia muris AS145]